MGRFQFGQIVLAYISDGHRTKERPALIISSDEDNDAGLKLQLIAITKSIEHPSPPYHVIVHDSTRLNTRTGLNSRCVAKCNWVNEVEQNRVIRSLGYLDNKTLDEVVKRYNCIMNDNSFNDWI